MGSRSRTVAPTGRATSGGAGQAAADGRELREQGRATRTRLLDAAVPVLADKGYRATRVDDVVGAAAVSHGTFYLYFANKEDLFASLARRCVDDVAELAAALPQVTPDAAGRTELRSWLARYVELYRQSGPVIRAWSEGQIADRTLARLGRDAFARIRDALADAMIGGTETSATALVAMIERFAYAMVSRDLAASDEAALDALALVAHRSFFGGS